MEVGGQGKHPFLIGCSVGKWCRLPAPGDWHFIYIHLPDWSSPYLIYPSSKLPILETALGHYYVRQAGLEEQLPKL